jgi:hypothetical protein
MESPEASIMEMMPTAVTTDVQLALAIALFVVCSAI